MASLVFAFFVWAERPGMEHSFKYAVIINMYGVVVVGVEVNYPRAHKMYKNRIWQMLMFNFYFLFIFL